MKDSLRQFVCRYSGDDWEEFTKGAVRTSKEKHARPRKWARGLRGKDGVIALQAGASRSFAGSITSSRCATSAGQRQASRSDRSASRLKAQGPRTTSPTKCQARRGRWSSAPRPACADESHARAFPCMSPVAPPRSLTRGAERSGRPPISATPNKVDVNTLRQVRRPHSTPSRLTPRKSREHESLLQASLRRARRILSTAPKIRFLAAAVILVGSFMDEAKRSASHQ